MCVGGGGGVERGRPKVDIRVREDKPRESSLMKEQTQEKTSHPPGTESCAATGQPARRSVDRKITGRNRKVKGLSPERRRRGRRGFTDSCRPHDEARQRRVLRQPTGIGDHG